MTALRSSKTLAACALVFAAHGAAHAGLVTGAWDPPFGAILPNLSYQVRTVLDVPDACSLQADGVYSTTAGACAGSTMQAAALRLFDTSLGDPNNFFQQNAVSVWASFTASPSVGYAIYQVRVQNSMVVGFSAGRPDVPFPLLESPVFLDASIAAQQGNRFTMAFDINGPLVDCLKCDPVNGYVSASALPNVRASTAGLQQFLLTFNDDGTPRATDANGRPVGAYLNGSGQVVGYGPEGLNLGTPVPLPGTAPLTLAALLALVATRRRRAG